MTDMRINLAKTNFSQEEKEVLSALLQDKGIQNLYAGRVIVCNIGGRDVNVSLSHNILFRDSLHQAGERRAIVFDMRPFAKGGRG